MSGSMFDGIEDKGLRIGADGVVGRVFGPPGVDFPWRDEAAAAAAGPWAALRQIADQLETVKGRRFDDPILAETLEFVARIVDEAVEAGEPTEPGWYAAADERLSLGMIFLRLPDLDVPGVIERHGAWRAYTADGDATDCVWEYIAQTGPVVRLTRPAR